MSSCPDYQPEPSNKVSDSYEGPDDGPPKLPKWAEQSAPDDVDGMTGLPKSVACNVDETPLVDDKFYIQFGDCPYLPYFSNRIQADRFARHVNNAIREAIEEARRELPGKTIEWGCGHTAEASCEECRNRDFERLNQLNMGVQRIAVEKASQRGEVLGLKRAVEIARGFKVLPDTRCKECNKWDNHNYDEACSSIADAIEAEIGKGE